MVGQLTIDRPLKAKEVDMTNAEKITMLETLLFPDGDATESDSAMLGTYLALAEHEILTYRYSYSANGIPEILPVEYDAIQVMAVMQGFAQSGAEGQTVSVENGVHRHWKYEDMMAYIYSHVIPIARVAK